MLFPLETILDHMQYLHPDIRLVQRGKWIKGISLMPRSADGLDTEMLYFCVDASNHPKDAITPYVMVNPMPNSSPDDQNCILLPYGTDITEVFNDVLLFVMNLHNWMQEVEISISRNEGVQCILDLSAKILGNPIVVITPAYRVVSATWDLETQNLVFSEFYTLGYLTQETWNILRDNDYYREEYYTGKTIVLPPSSIKEYTSTLNAVIHNGEVGFLILMLCSNFDYSPGVAQLYEFILQKLRHYLTPLIEKSESHRSQFDYFMVELLDGKVSQPAEIYERSSIYGRTYNSAFHTVLIQLEQSSDLYLAHLIQVLNQHFPDVYTLLYNRNVVMHFKRISGGQDLWMEQLTTLNDLLESLHANAGISEPLVGIENVNESYRQAKFTLEYGIQILGRKLCNHYLGEDMDLPRLFSFGEYHVFSMLSGKETKAPLLSRIHQFDEEHGTDYHRILFVYLSTERNFTHAAKLLHMHRNNVIYHIRRISEIFNLDLDRPNLRLRILMLYRLEDMYQ